MRLAYEYAMTERAAENQRWQQSDQRAAILAGAAGILILALAQVGDAMAWRDLTCLLLAPLAWVCLLLAVACLLLAVLPRNAARASPSEALSDERLRLSEEDYARAHIEQMRGALESQKRGNEAKERSLKRASWALLLAACLLSICAAQRWAIRPASPGKESQGPARSGANDRPAEADEPARIAPREDDKTGIADTDARGPVRPQEDATAPTP